MLVTGVAIRFAPIAGWDRQCSRGNAVSWSRLWFVLIALGMIGAPFAFARANAPGGLRNETGATLPSFTIAQSEETLSATAATRYLARVMDEFHTRVPVYDDVSSAGNHFTAYAKIPDEQAPVTINGSATDNPHSGATALRCELRPGGPLFGGFYFLNGVLPAGATAPIPNFGTVPNAGVDLRGAVALTFWARGARGGERVEFFVGGVGRNPYSGMPIEPYPDSSPRTPPIGTLTTLSAGWREYTIDLRNQDLSYVLGGFGWVASSVNNPTGAVFYLDDIQFELSDAARIARLNEPRFLRSFATAPVQSLPAPVGDFDLVMRNVAFTYDNALALLAFLTDGSPDSERRARLIGDAFVYAMQHDRTFNDGRLRTAYAAGDLALPPGWTPNGRHRTVRIPGYYDEIAQRFVEVEQGAIDSGNNAWALIALLSLYRRTGESRYLEAARDIAAFLHTMRNDNGLYQGFLGGIDQPESAQPANRRYASSEHNLDIAAALTELFLTTNEPRWLSDAQHAETFVAAMWDDTRGCYLPGTLDPYTRNTNVDQLPLDVQAWTTLALPLAHERRLQTLACAKREHRTDADGFSGYDFNTDRDGVWFEGTAQMALAAAYNARLFKDPAERATWARHAAELRAELRRAQGASPAHPDAGIVAASRDGLSSGFGFRYFQRLRIGATAWLVLAQREVNPFHPYRNYLPLVVR